MNKNFFVITPAKQTVINIVALLFSIHGIYMLFHEESLWWLGLAFSVYSVFNISVTAGFHQLLTHRSYSCSKFWEYLFTVCGTLAFQGSSISWVHLHYVHHNTSDTHEDPHVRGLWFFIFKKYNAVITKPSKVVMMLLKDPVHKLLHLYGGALCILFSALLLAIDYKLFVFGYMLPVAYFYLAVSCHQIFTHIGNKPVDVPFFMLLFPWADWNHVKHHERPADIKNGGWCLSYEFIRLIQK